MKKVGRYLENQLNHLSIILAAGTECGNELNWPDLKDYFLCGDCKVLVDKMKTKYKTCHSYCSTIGRKCTGAWEDSSDDCKVKDTQDCEHIFDYTSDAICECGEEAGAFHI